MALTAVVALLASAVSLAAVEPRFRASGVPAVAYGGTAPASRHTDPFLNDVAAALREGSSGRTVVPRGDARLDAVAADVARLGREPDRAVLLHLMSHHGLVDPEPWLLIFGATAAAERTLIAEVRAAVRTTLVSRSAARVGLGIAREGTGLVLAIALMDEGIALEPVRRALPRGGEAPLAGSLPRGFTAPQVIVTLPSGSVHPVLVTRRGRSFSARLRCAADSTGPYQVEVAADGAGGPTVLANFPVYCGVAPPSDVRVAPATKRPPVDGATAARSLHERANRERARAHVGPLAWDDKLAAVARSYAEELATSGRVAHVSAQSGSLADRLRAARLAPKFAGENLGMAGSVDEVHDGLMGSPGHRGVILDRRFTRVGIGVVVRQDEGGQPRLYSVQAFTGD